MLSIIKELRSFLCVNSQEQNEWEKVCMTSDLHVWLGEVMSNNHDMSEMKRFSCQNATSVLSHGAEAYSDTPACCYTLCSYKPPLLLCYTNSLVLCKQQGALVKFPFRRWAFHSLRLQCSECNGMEVQSGRKWKHSRKVAKLKSHLHFLLNVAFLSASPPV